MRVREVMYDSIPCALCKYAKDNGMVVYCEIKGEIICDRQYIKPEDCWKYCECASCPYREPISEV